MTKPQRDQRKILIIGGVAGGASAATKARRENESAEIILFEKGPHVSFANCGLPYHVSQEIENREDLFVVTPERLRQRFNLDLRTHSEVTAIDPKRKVVEVLNHHLGEAYEETYDKLIIATGADPIVPQIPGVDQPFVFTLKTIDDMDAIIDHLTKNEVRSAAVVGGGFIGIEVAEALHTRNVDVTVIEAMPQILSAWDPDMADPVERYMEETLFIDIIKGDAVREISRDPDGVRTCVLESEETIPCDLVILAIGVKPNTALAKSAGLRLGRRSLIITDDQMRTSDPHIYAVGDAVQSVQRVSKETTWLPLAGPANRQGRVAGANAAGSQARFPGVIGTSIVRIGEICAARTGLSEREAAGLEIPYFTTNTSGMSHASYYPGARELTIKLIVQTVSGKLLGAQVVGLAGVDTRINVLATALVAGMTVEDIVDIELAYAPPFSSAKDPINIAAMVAHNILTGSTETAPWEEVLGSVSDIHLIDVRSEDERKTVYVTGGELISLDTLRQSIDKLDRDTPIRLYCRIGQRGYYAERILKSHGFKDVKNISGGWRAIWGELRDDHLVGQEPVSS